MGDSHTSSFMAPPVRPAAVARLLEALTQRSAGPETAPGLVIGDMYVREAFDIRAGPNGLGFSFGGGVYVVVYPLDSIM